MKRDKHFSFLRKRVFRVQFLLALFGFLNNSLANAATAAVIWNDLSTCLANPRICISSIQGSLKSGSSSIAEIRRNFLLQYAVLHNSPDLLAQLEFIIGPLALNAEDKVKMQKEVKALQEKYAKPELAASAEGMKNFSSELLEILSNSHLSPDLLAKISAPLESAGLMSHGELDYLGGASPSATSTTETSPNNNEANRASEMGQKLERIVASVRDGGGPSDINKLVEEEESTEIVSNSDELDLSGRRVNIVPAINNKNLKNNVNLANNSQSKASKTQSVSSGASGGARVAGKFEEIIERTDDGVVGGASETGNNKVHKTQGDVSVKQTQEKGSLQNASVSKESDASGADDQKKKTEDALASRTPASAAEAKTHNVASGESASSNTDIETTTADQKLSPATTALMNSGTSNKADPLDDKGSSLLTQQLVANERSRELVNEFFKSGNITGNNAPFITQVNESVGKGDFQQAEALIKAQFPTFANEYVSRSSDRETLLEKVNSGQYSDDAIAAMVNQYSMKHEDQRISDKDAEPKKIQNRVGPSIHNKLPAGKMSPEQQMSVFDKIKKLRQEQAKADSIKTKQAIAKKRSDDETKEPEALKGAQLAECNNFYNSLSGAFDQEKIKADAVKNKRTVAEQQCSQVSEKWKAFAGSKTAGETSTEKSPSSGLLYRCIFAYQKLGSFNEILEKETAEYVSGKRDKLSTYKEYLASSKSQLDSLEISSKLLFINDPLELLCDSLVSNYKVADRWKSGKLHDSFRCGSTSRSTEIGTSYFDEKAYQRFVSDTKMSQELLESFNQGQVDGGRKASFYDLNDNDLVEAQSNLGRGLGIFKTLNTAEGNYYKTTFIFNYLKLQLLEQQNTATGTKYSEKDFDERLKLLSSKPKDMGLYTNKLWELLYGACSSEFLHQGYGCERVVSLTDIKMVKYGYSRGTQRVSRPLDFVDLGLLGESADVANSLNQIAKNRICAGRGTASSRPVVHSQ